MAICRYFQAGNCRFGESCRYEHPPPRSQPAYQSQNRFAPLNSSSPGHGSQQSRNFNQNARGNNNNNQNTPPYSLDKETIRSDLTSDCPMWILSCYGPGRQAPIQLFEGSQREQSFEEMRLRFYELASQGNEQQALAEQEKLITDAQQQMVSVLKDLDGAIAYIIAGENQHPNRVDVCTEPDTTSRSQTQAFGTPAPTSGFGQPSSFQSRPMAPNNQGQSAFGRPSAFSSNALSTIANPFAKPTAPVAATQLPSNPFGHQQSSAAAGAFGQPAPAAISGFTQASSTNPFAQATQNTSTPMLSSPMSRHSALATTDSRGNVISWGGKKVVYIDDEPCFRRNDGRWERIWFPSGCPLAKDPDLPLDAYDQAVEQEYKHIKDHGTFAGGKMPMLPPKKEWCDWDF